MGELEPQGETGFHALVRLVRAVENDQNVDLYLISGPMMSDVADRFVRLVRDRKDRRPKIGIIATTYGGAAESAYRIIRHARRFYEHVTLYVFGTCKSAGTLLALGATEVVMSHFGELGPLDVQVAKQDEIASYNSGLDVTQAIFSISAHAYQIWESSYLKITAGSGGSITTRTASDIAATLAVGLMSPVTSQIDPLKLGEMERASTISREYGYRLTDNNAAVDKLISGYPSHGFVIDLEEARDVLGDDVVRDLTEAEGALEAYLVENYDGVRRPGETTVVRCLSGIEVPPEERHAETRPGAERSEAAAPAPKGNGAGHGPGKPDASDEAPGRPAGDGRRAAGRKPGGRPKQAGASKKN